jgi:hypothetical protein
MPYPLLPRRGNRHSAEPSSGKSLPRWPCLLPSTVVGVAPLRNLTGEANRQGLVDGFTDRLFTGLFRHCRGLSFAWVADERRYADNLPPRNPPELSYVVYGSVQEAATGTCGSTYASRMRSRRITCGRVDRNSDPKTWHQSRPR